MTLRRTLGLGLLLIPLVAAQNVPRNDIELIRQARRQHNAAIARRDYPAIAQRWTEDISVRAGLGRVLNGRQAYRDAFVADSAMTYVRDPREIVVSTNWPLAYERGRWTGTLRGSQRPATLSGEYSAQWVKRGNEWLIRSELFVALSCSSEACSWPASVP